MADNAIVNAIAEFFSNNWETLVIALIVALIGFFLWLIRYSITTKSQRKERTADRIAKQKDESLEKINEWAEECLKYFNEISIKIHGTDLPTIKSLEIYSDLQRLEAPGKLAYSSANILDEDARKKTKNALDKLHEVTIAFRNRDNHVWGKMPKVVESFSELIDYLSKEEL